ncbi:MAG: VOC family protein [Caldilineaceae bacterium]
MFICVHLRLRPLLQGGKDGIAGNASHRHTHQNLDEMVQFYTEMLGCPVTRRWDDVNIVFVNVGSTTLNSSAATRRSRKAYAGRIDHIELHVPSTDAVNAELVAKGVTFRTRRDFKNVRTPSFFDPDGNVLELVEEKDD